jgi:hypothetical protein
MQKIKNSKITLPTDIASASILLIPIILYEVFHSPLPAHKNVPLRIFMLDAPLACFGFVWLMYRYQSIFYYINEKFLIYPYAKILQVILAILSIVATLAILWGKGRQ